MRGRIAALADGKAEFKLSEIPHVIVFGIGQIDGLLGFLAGRNIAADEGIKPYAVAAQRVQGEVKLLVLTLILKGQLNRVEAVLIDLYAVHPNCVIFLIHRGIGRNFRNSLRFALRFRAASLSALFVSAGRHGKCQDACQCKYRAFLHLSVSSVLQGFLSSSKKHSMPQNTLQYPRCNSVFSEHFAQPPSLFQTKKAAPSDCLFSFGYHRPVHGVTV